MTLDAHEFIRCFLLHTLPSGFHRIRRYGFLANDHGSARLELCRRLLAARQSDEILPKTMPSMPPASLPGEPIRVPAAQPR